MDELTNLTDARRILSKAYLDTIGLGVVHDHVWNAIVYIEQQIKPILEHLGSEEAA